MKRGVFNGWALEDWSLQHELLELRFRLLAPATRQGVKTQMRSRSRKKTERYRAKAIFIRPMKMKFSDFTSGSVVEDFIVMKLSDDVFAYRFVLQGQAFAEIIAEDCVSAFW
ncbi:MAG: hypothetical protein ACKVRO_13575 [Micropepsaceae bacterium]